LSISILKYLIKSFSQSTKLIKIW